MTTALSLFNQLAEIINDGNGDLEVIAVHGASGTYDPVGSAHVSRVEEGDEDLMELLPGAEFVCVYTGN